MKTRRRLPVGAEIMEQGVHFRVWAPDHSKVTVVLEDQCGAIQSRQDLSEEPQGYFSGIVREARRNSLYRFSLDASDERLPDPASRFQPQGVFGPSQVIDPDMFAWSDKGWPGRLVHGQVAYELHLGTFTPEGTWDSAGKQLATLAEIGVTLVEVMPVAEFAGDRGWGYDGADMFAPMHVYGAPDDMRRFVDQAHSLNMGVILDVVYNHYGSVGNFLGKFASAYYSKKHVTDWGQAPNYDGEDSSPVRELVTANAGYWIDEYHLDGLRLDATQCVYDDSRNHILGDISDSAHRAAKGRPILVIAENEPEDVGLITPKEYDGLGMEGLWNDDFHHSAAVALTGRREAYYLDYQGTPQELISSVKRGFLYQGQYYHWQGKRRGTPSLNVEPASLVQYLENHDQVANSLLGLRLHQQTSPGRYRAMTALLLLAPQTPMLFQGQEFAASAPFLFFCDLPGVGDMVKTGRAKFLGQFKSLATPDMLPNFADPMDIETFRRCKLDLTERERHARQYLMHKDLLRIRREDTVFSSQRRGGLDGAVLGANAFVLRFFGDEAGDRLLLVNLGPDLDLRPAPEPLLAPPRDCAWSVMWTSEDPAYGGTGTPPPEDENGAWRILGESAVVMKPVSRKSDAEHPGAGKTGNTPSGC